VLIVARLDLGQLVKEQRKFIQEEVIVVVSVGKTDA